MPPIASLREAKAGPSALVDRAAAGEEVVIARNGKPREPAGAIRIRHLAPDFDAPDDAIENLFAGDGSV